MDSMVVMLMEKEVDSGFLVKEIGSYTVEQHGELIDGIFSIREEQKEVVHLRLTVGKDVEDWEFSAIYDEYNPGVLEQHILSFDELDESYNPTWKITFDFIENQNTMERMLNTILEIHKQELDRVYGEIIDKKSYYE